LRHHGISHWTRLRQLLHSIGVQLPAPTQRSTSRAAGWDRTQQTDATPRYGGDVRAARVIGLPSVHKCATLNGLGVGTRESNADAGPRRCALSRRALREFPVLLVLERQLGGRIFSVDPDLACRRSLTTVLLCNPPRNKGAGGPHPAAGPELKKRAGTPKPDPDHPVKRNRSTVQLLRTFRASTFTSAPSSAHDGFGLLLGGRRQERRYDVRSWIVSTAFRILARSARSLIYSWRFRRHPAPIASWMAAGGHGPGMRPRSCPP
jgi:hypothetical protein